jgi:heme/copper-type cytochrome/quinol oxidase subunit 3
MKITLLPETRPGKWAVAMFIVFIALIAAAGTISSTQWKTAEYPSPFNNPLLGSVIYLMFSAAIIASVAGLIAVKKNNERSILVYLSIPLGLLYFIGILILLAGVIIGPPN